VLVTGWRRSLSGTAGLFEVDLTNAKVHHLGAAGDDFDSVAADLLEEPMVGAATPVARTRAWCCSQVVAPW
jgi:hypothetical protein